VIGVNGRTSIQRATKLSTTQAELDSDSLSSGTGAVAFTDGIPSEFSPVAGIGVVRPVKRRDFLACWKTRCSRGRTGGRVPLAETARVPPEVLHFQFGETTVSSRPF
jgi:hypothetical protein